MTPQQVKSDISELESLRRRAAIWRWGTIAAVLLIMLVGVGLMNQAVQNLIRPGAGQERFVAQVNTGLQRNVVPELQTLATQTLTESQPIVQEEVAKLNARVPEVADVAMKQFQLLQTELPESSSKVLNKTFGQMLSERKAKVKAMYPDATDEQIDQFITNLSEQGTQSMTNVSVRLFDRHIETMSAISDNVDQIQRAEAPNIKDEIPTWQMGLLIFDIARADMGDLQLTKKPGAGKMDPGRAESGRKQRRSFGHRPGKDDATRTRWRGQLAQLSSAKRVGAGACALFQSAVFLLRLARLEEGASPAPPAPAVNRRTRTNPNGQQNSELQRRCGHRNPSKPRPRQRPSSRPRPKRCPFAAPSKAAISPKDS